jgi:hypothetical protein
MTRKNTRHTFFHLCAEPAVFLGEAEPARYPVSLRSAHKSVLLVNLA